MIILVSACLLGKCCRYDGKGYDPILLGNLAFRYSFFPMCPEQLGGLSTPRSPSECRGERVFFSSGEEVTEAFQRGAKAALHLAIEEGCCCALLKERSPSCGSTMIYDGTFSGRKISGEGVTARLLRQNKIAVFSEEQLDLLERWLQEQDEKQKNTHPTIGYTIEDGYAE